MAKGKLHTGRNRRRSGKLRRGMMAGLLALTLAAAPAVTGVVSIGSAAEVLAAPNDSINSAVTLQSGRTVTIWPAFKEYGYTYNWYKISLNQDSMVQLDFHEENLKNNGIYWVEYSFYNPQGDVIDYGSIIDYNSDSEMGNEQFRKFVKKGEWYLRLETNCGSYKSAGSQPKVQITYTAAPYTKKNETDRDHGRAADAQDWNYNTTNIYGGFTWPEDTDDFYRIRKTDDREIVFTLSDNEFSNFAINLYDADGDSIYSGVHRNSNSLQKTLTADIEAGTYYV